jgi:hypothetical protein
MALGVWWGGKVPCDHSPERSRVFQRLQLRSVLEKFCGRIRTEAKEVNKVKHLRSLRFLLLNSVWLPAVSAMVFVERL